MPARAVSCHAEPVTAAAASRWDIPVVVATDDAWQEAYGGEGERAADRVIDDVNDILQPTGVNLAIAGHVGWAGSGANESMAEMLEQLEDSSPAQPGRLVIGLTGRQLSRVDGVARVGESHLVARLHQNRPRSDGPVVAHEVGHVLGAEHDECRHEFQCVMAPKGPLQPAHWCTHQLLQVQAGAGRLLAE